jgi:hypothetical protein
MSDWNTFLERHHKDPRPSELTVNIRNLDPFVAFKNASAPFCVLGFNLKIKFSRESGLKLFRKPSVFKIREQKLG